MTGSSTLGDGRKAGPTRRAFLRTSAAIVAGTGVLSAPGIVRGATPEPESELVFGMSGGNTQRMFEEKFFPAFTAKYKTKITYVAGQPADLVAKARSQKGQPAMDVIFLGGSYSYQSIDEDLVTPVNPDLVPNLKLIAPSLMTETKITPVGIATAGILTNTDAHKKNNLAEPTSWFDCWDPKYKGHVGLYSISTAATNGMLVKVSQELTGDYHNLDKAFAKFRDLKPSVIDFYTSAGAWETAMQQGDLWIGCNTATRAMQMKQSGMPVGFPALKEGLVGYGNFLGLIKGAPHPTIGQLFIDYMLSTEAQQLMVEAIGYNSVNKNVVVPDAIKAYFPPTDTLFIPDWRYLAQQGPAIVDRWNREIER
jgi:putative spermidine/putrescine transport system substrate-binding protein